MRYESPCETSPLLLSAPTEWMGTAPGTWGDPVWQGWGRGGITAIKVIPERKSLLWIRLLLPSEDRLLLVQRVIVITTAIAIIML